MNFKEFIIEANKTILFKDNKTLLACTALGLMGEMVELYDHIENNSTNSLILKELGDISWYVAVLSHHLNLELDISIARPYYSLRTCGYQSIGHLQEIIKKALRDNDGIVPEEKKDILLVDLSELLDGIQTECLIRQINFSDVLQQNVEKLASRAERGVLQGSGDER